MTKYNPFGVPLPATFGPAPALAPAATAPYRPPWMPGPTQQPITSTFGSNPTPAPTPPPAPTNYLQNIENDPLYQQSMSALNAQGIADAAQRKGATDQALIQFGEIPNLSDALNGFGLSQNSPAYQMLSQDIDAATTKAAAGLTSSGLSTVAQLTKGHNTALDSLMNTLAARGIVRSGSTGVGVGLENQNYLKSQYDARSSLLQYLSGVQSAYTSAQQALEAQREAAAEAAAQRGASAPPPPPPGNGGGITLVGGPGGTRNIPNPGF